MIFNSTRKNPVNICRLWMVLAGVMLVGCATPRYDQPLQTLSTIADLKTQLWQKDQLISELRADKDFLKSALTKNRDKKNTLDFAQFRKRHHKNNEDIANKEPKNRSLLVKQDQRWTMYPPQSTEHLLYSKIIEAYEHRDYEELKRAIEILDKAFPQSVHLDNALILQARLELKKSEFQKALETVTWVVESLRTSNKVPTALFIKGMLLLRLNRGTEAEACLHELIHKYPGSVEFYWALRELDKKTKTSPLALSAY